MKIFLCVVILSVLAFADNDGCTEIGSGSSPQGSDDVFLTLLNDWGIAEMSLGLGVFEGPVVTYLLAAQPGIDTIRAYSTSGAPAGTMTLDAANGSCFGIAWNDDVTNDTYYTNDWEISNLFFTDNHGATWSTTPNPAGSNARGMDFDGTDYWTTNGNGGGVWRFLPGVGQQNIATPELPTTPSGLTVFPYQSNLGIAVTCYQTFSIYFYVWDSSTMTFLGSAPCPVSGLTKSYGLAYTGTTETFFWTYQDGSGNYHLAEFSMSTNALEHSSWGAIKGSF